MSRSDDFWSRRRAGVEAEQATDVATEKADVEAAERRAFEDQSDEEILAALNLPDPDTLKQGDDVSGFMARMVPDRLRRRALRQLFRLNPVLANVDGLVEYGEDYTDAAMAVENLQTTYQVGKGMLAHVKEMERQAQLAAEAEAAEQSPDEGTPDDVAPDAEAMALIDKAEIEGDIFQDAPESTDTTESVNEAAVFSEDDSGDYATPAPRRMQFSFKDKTA